MQREREGEGDLSLYVVTCREHTVSETIAKAWRMKGAEAEVVEMNKDHHTRLREAGEGRKMR